MNVIKPEVDDFLLLVFQNNRIVSVNKVIPLSLKGAHGRNSIRIQLER